MGSGTSQAAVPRDSGGSQSLLHRHHASVLSAQVSVQAVWKGQLGGREDPLRRPVAQVLFKIPRARGGSSGCQFLSPVCACVYVSAHVCVRYSHAYSPNSGRARRWDHMQALAADTLPTRG